MPNEFGAGVTVNTVSRNTEIGRTERFVETIKRTHRFVPETKEWRVCPDGVWRKTAEKQVLEQAFQFIKKDAQRIAGMENDRDREEAMLITGGMQIVLVSPMSLRLHQFVFWHNWTTSIPTMTP